MPIKSKQQPPYYTTNDVVKTLVLILEQDSTNAPLITTIQNTFNETITPGYDAQGSYNLTKATAFIPNKTTVFVEQSDYDGLTLYNAYPDVDGKIYITSRLWSSPNWTLENDIMTRLAIKITQYP